MFAVTHHFQMNFAFAVQSSGSIKMCCGEASRLKRLQQQFSDIVPCNQVNNQFKPIEKNFIQSHILYACRCVVFAFVVILLLMVVDMWCVRAYVHGVKCILENACNKISWAINDSVYTVLQLTNAIHRVLCYRNSLFVYVWKDKQVLSLSLASYPLHVHRTFCVCF